MRPGVLDSLEGQPIPVEMVGGPRDGDTVRVPFGMPFIRIPAAVPASVSMVASSGLSALDERYFRAVDYRLKWRQFSWDAIPVPRYVEENMAAGLLTLEVKP